MVSIPILQHPAPKDGRILYKNIEGACRFDAPRFTDFRGDYVNLDPRMTVIEAGTAFSNVNVIRGFHCSPYPKLVGCLSGEMYDVLLDLRPKSPTFMKWEAITLTAVTSMDSEDTMSAQNGAGGGSLSNGSNPIQKPTYIYIPPGVAHAYLATKSNTLTLYLKGGVFDASKEVNCNVYDPELNISWPISKDRHIITDKDRNLPVLKSLIEQNPEMKALMKQKKLWYAPNKFEAYGEDEILAVTKCLRDGWLAPGPRTTEFENQVAKYFGKKYGIMVNSGSSANLLGLASYEFPKGSEIVTPACTFSTVIAPIEQLGLKPVLVDVGLRHYIPAEQDILDAITPKTVMLMIPNLIGSKPDWKFLKESLAEMGRSDIILFEDSCDCMTCTPESDCAAISFYASHIITAAGQGGVFMTNSEKLLNKCYQYRDWGRLGNNSEDMVERFKDKVDNIEYDGKFLYSVQGYNFKSCEICAAFGLEQMKKLDHFMNIRRRNIKRFCDNINKMGPNSRYLLPRDDYNDMDWLALPLQHPNRKGVIHFLEENGVQIRVTFAGNVTRHPAYRHHFKGDNMFPNSDVIMSNGFLIGAHHGIREEEVDHICSLLEEFDRTDQERMHLG